MRTLCYWITRALLSLRYKIRVEGLRTIRRDPRSQGGGILFLPNHPAEIDPVILNVILGPRFRVRPLVTASFYYLKNLRFFMWLVRALPLPRMGPVSNLWKQKEIKKRLEEISSALRKGDNILIYPAGILKRGPEEVIGGASFVHALIQNTHPHVVLIRTTGLWGSRFSYAPTGQTPEFGKTLWTTFKLLLKNGIFFAPRRAVKIEMTFAPADFPYASTRLELNKYLEKWYNQQVEPLSLVSDCFWKKEFPSIADLSEKRESLTPVSVPKEVERAVLTEIARKANCPIDRLQPKMRLAQDLGLDSLDLVDLYAFLDEKFDVVDLPFGELKSVEDVLQAAVGKKRDLEKHKHKKREQFAWPIEENRLLPVPITGETLQEAFLAIASRMGNSVACADSLSGVFTYKQLKRAALVLALSLEKLPGDKIGILLPSLSMTYLLVLASLIAKKIPVMLNWTAGVRSLNHAASVTGIQTTLSSRRFLDRPEIGDLGTVGEQIVLLEDIRDNLSLGKKLHGYLHSLLPTKFLMKHLGLHRVKKEDPAVILFTSGTESLPKGVPLSHKNILSNQQAVFSVIDLTEKDLFLGVLPPFHSFGFSITGLLPLLIGLKCCYAPDPTDSHGLAFEMARFRPTLFCSAPSFIRALFRVASPEDLTSIRYFVSGAEKTPEELFQYVKKLGEGHEMLEGYGITECAPVVTVTRPHLPPKGVGPPLPGVELAIIDAEKNILSAGQEGEICIHGPNVFSGYLGQLASPFVELHGKRWYLSGDRGYLDKEGNLFLLGRMRRFVKIGGEMVSLVGLEEELLKLTKQRGWLKEREEKPVLAICVREKEAEKPLLILITTIALDRDEINAALREGGFGRIVKIHEVKKVEEIPLTGTGKTHYRLLDEMMG